jgi:DNA-binding GntR family transcriptional regulator
MMSPSAIQPDPRAYVRIAGVVREMISSQVLPPGSPAPSITMLCREHGHARQTCGRAMRLLEDEGLLHRVPGLGYHVTVPRTLR